MNSLEVSRFAQRSGYKAALPVLVLILLGLPRPATAATTLRPADAARAAKYSEARRGNAILVMQNGQTIYEHYANGGATDRRWPIYSGTKSFWGIAALVAAQEGLISLDGRVADIITEWKSDARKSRITIRQLLNATDGLDGAPPLHRQSIRDRNAEAVRLPVVAGSGSAFIYGPSHLQIFAEVLRRKLGGSDPASYLQQKVLSPLGLGNLDYKRDKSGNALPATGFELSAREWARFGKMILDDGRGIVDGAVLRQAFNGSRANPAYGLTFWLNRQAPVGREADIEDLLDLKWQQVNWGGVCFCREAPADTLVALGSGYQRLFIIPSLKALIVRQGKDREFSDAEFLRLVLGRAR